MVASDEYIGAVSKAVDFTHPATEQFMSVAERVIVVCKLKRIINTDISNLYIDIWFSYKQNNEWFQANDDENMFEHHNRVVVYIKIVPTDLYELVELLAKQKKFESTIEQFAEHIRLSKSLEDARHVLKDPEMAKQARRKRNRYVHISALKAFGMEHRNFRPMLISAVTKMIIDYRKTYDNTVAISSVGYEKFITELFKGNGSKYFTDLYYAAVMNQIRRIVQSCNNSSNLIHSGAILAFLEPYG